MIVRYVVLLAAIVFYAFSLSTLLKIIKQENFSKSFLRIIDSDSDGIITKKEMASFKPCEGYDGKKIKRAFLDYGRRADLNDLALDLDSKTIINSIKMCVGDVVAFTNPDHLKHLKQSQVQKQMMDTYDINKDGVITWGEFNIANSTMKTQSPYARTVFKFFDKNHDWKITKKELTKVKVKQLATYIGSGGKRRK